MMPRLAATESSQASALAGQCACGPSVVSIEVAAGADEPEDQPVEHDADDDDQRQRQCDRFPNTARSGGANIWVRALMASSNIFRLCKMAEVATVASKRK